MAVNDTYCNPSIVFTVNNFRSGYLPFNEDLPCGVIVEMQIFGCILPLDEDGLIEQPKRVLISDSNEAITEAARTRNSS